MNEEWDDLSDSELRARLIQRGLEVSNAYWLVSQRDASLEVRVAITKALR